MMKNKISIKSILLIIALGFVAFGCKEWGNFTTYYNTYYNQERLLEESENEFFYQTEKKKNIPRVIVPDSSLFNSSIDKNLVPSYMTEYVISKQQRQGVEKQLDSILQKGSKIILRHPKSDYIVKTLYNIALAYYYKNEWLPSQVKCAEIVDKYPEDQLAPDALILYAKSLLIQRKFEQAEVMLSRTVDLAWVLKRFDILSEAFRLQAETRLYLNELEEALKPYKQAIIQTDDKTQKARWQLDLSLLLYRIGKFDKAILEFSKVYKYRPDYITTFETQIYTANSLIFLNRFDEAEKIIEKLDDDGKYDEWKYSIYSSKLLLAEHQGDLDKYKEIEKTADSLYPNNPALLASYYLRGKSLYDSNDYNKALQYFTKARITRTPVFNSANQIHAALNNWKLKHSQILTAENLLRTTNTLTDSARAAYAKNLFELGRLHEQLGNKDSVEFYYNKSIKNANIANPESAKYMYVYALSLQKSDLQKSDSLMDFVANNYPLTDYGKDAIKRMGYTDAFVIDTAADLFNSGTNLMQNKEYNYSILQFSKLINEHPNNKLEPRTLYSIGWLYERKLFKYDSALYYYKILVDKYPNSEYAKDVRYSVDYLAVMNSGEDIPDHLKERKQENYVPLFNREEALMPPPMVNKPQVEHNLNMQDIINDPKQLLKGAQKFMQDKIDKIQNFDPNSQIDSLKKIISLDSLTNIKIDNLEKLEVDSTEHK